MKDHLQSHHPLMSRGAFQLTSSLNGDHSEQGEQEGDSSVPPNEAEHSDCNCSCPTFRLCSGFTTGLQHTQRVWRGQLGLLRFSEASRPYHNILWQCSRLTSKVNSFATHLPTSGKGCYWGRVLLY